MVYELKINVKRGTVNGGGLANNAYVEVWIDGMLVETTASVPSPPEWNKEVIKDFDTLESATPIVISFTMFKKRWTSEGFKLVGSCQFLLSELVEKLNKGPVNKNLTLVAGKKNITLSGTISISVELTGGSHGAEDELDMFSREKRLMNRASVRLTRNNNALSKMYSIFVPKPEDQRVKPSELGIVSKVYRYLFHFDNQVFGRLVKILVLGLWLIIIKYSMDLWVSMKDTSDRVDGSLERVVKMFAELR